MILISSLLSLTAAMDRTTLTVSWILNMKCKAPPQKKANLITSESSPIEPDHCCFETFDFYLVFTRWCYCDVKMTWNMCYGHRHVEKNLGFISLMHLKVCVALCVITHFFCGYNLYYFNFFSFCILSAPTQEQGFSLEEKSKTSKKRVHYMKFTKGESFNVTTSCKWAIILHDFILRTLL